MFLQKEGGLVVKTGTSENRFVTVVGSETGEMGRKAGSCDGEMTAGTAVTVMQH